MYDSVLSSVSAIEKLVCSLQAETISLRETVSEQARAIHFLQSELYDSEQCSRFSNLYIHGLPVTLDENLSAAVGNPATSLGLLIPQSNDTLSVHRHPAKADATQVVLVQISF